MDLTAVKKELREIHNMPENQVRITADLLAKAQLKNKANNPYSNILGIVIGGLVLSLGIALFFLFEANGVIGTLPYICSGAGIGILIKSLNLLKS